MWLNISFNEVRNALYENLNKQTKCNYTTTTQTK
jgi:hypothetical protein